MREEGCLGSRFTRLAMIQRFMQDRLNLRELFEYPEKIWWIELRCNARGESVPCVLNNHLSDVCCEECNLRIAKNSRKYQSNE